MFGFLDLGRKSSPVWLSPEPFGEQDLQTATRQKGELRKILLEAREKLKQHALLHNLPWGLEHIRQIATYLKHCGLCPSNDHLSLHRGDIAGYWPIGSELGLLPESQQSNGRATGVDKTKWWLPGIRQDKQMDWFELCDETQSWPKDKRGLPIPPESVFKGLFPSKPDVPWLVLTPCLAADRAGVRLGYGGGFYDRFLQKNNDNCLSVACVPASLFFEKGKLPADDHDFPVDMVVTENQVWVRDEHALEFKLKKFS
ncbi:MAG: 5-formyltetrahydrofolate cyclo-ligase [Silvanigrellaceae bacterium]